MRRRAITEMSDQKHDRASVDHLEEELKKEFCDLTRSYYLFSIERLRKHVTKTTNNVKGMACFDPYVMRKMPIDFATRCFGDL